MIHWLRNVPFSILAACVLISVIGLFGLQRADELYGASRLFERQLIWISLAWPAMLAVTVVSYRPLRHLSPWLYVGSLLLLVVARLAFILALAHYLMHRDSQKTVRGLLPPFVMTMLPLLLILREPDLGTAMLFLPILYAMLFVAGARPTHLLVAALIGVAMLPLMWQQMSREQKSRVVMVFNQTDGGLAPSGDGFHLHQSKQVFALGGLWGSVSRDEPIIDDPSAYILPAARTDFILSVIAERYGVAGAAVLLLLYGVIVVRGLAIAKRTKEPFGRLAAVGIVTMIATQALINASMTVGLMPITGITLPMCSYGGSSLLSTCIAMGLLMNVAMHPGYEVAG